MAEAVEALWVRREIVIQASPETVWGFLVDPEKALSWWGMAMDVDARAGGAYRIEVVPGQTASGVFVEVDPPRRLVYTWGWEAAADEITRQVPPGSSTVVVELTPRDDGTLLRLTHRDLPTGETAAAHGVGWEHYLGRLAQAAAGHDPGPDPWRGSAAAG